MTRTHTLRYRGLFSIAWTIIVLQLGVFGAQAQQRDVIKVMSYNVLKYGNGCQGPNGLYHAYLKTIVSYTSPDILGLVKVASIPQKRGGRGKAPFGFADSVLDHALNSAYPGRYACCPFTNKAENNDICLLFYNKNKFGYSRYLTLVTYRSDIDIYKLYYKDASLARTHDTAFLYIVLWHSDSGDEPKHRNKEAGELAQSVKKLFPALPSVIIMGDFNLRKTDEAGYQSLVNSGDKNYNFIDPPFGIDRKVAYPGNWDKHPERFAPYLTTSTRRKKGQPNDCGTGGGAKDWYDHILLSPRMAAPSNYFHYVPGSYVTIGNDGERVGRSVNDLPNRAAPPSVLDALYNMSNKYPVMIEVGIGR